MNLRKIAGTLVMSLDLAAYAWPITIGVLVAAVVVLAITRLLRFGELRTSDARCNSGGAVPRLVLEISLLSHRPCDE